MPEPDPTLRTDDRDLLAWSPAAVAEFFAANGVLTAHAATLWADVHRRLAPDLDHLLRTPVKVREFLVSSGLTIDTPRLLAETVSVDGFTRKFLLGLRDGGAVETVLMRFQGRATACLSTQVGCAMGCVFCATGQAGFTRHLSTGEIVAQALHVARLLRTTGHSLRNVVFMGQGEPLHNYDAVMRAVDLLLDPGGLAIAAPRATISTVGLVPGIRRMAEERRPCSLAVSLHAASDEERATLVPTARRWPLAELMEACRHYTVRTSQKVFFEWTLIAGVNDDPGHATRLADLLVGQKAHVNLIPLNPTNGFGGAASRPDHVRAFSLALQARGIPATVRQRRGIEIAAGCGQLAAAAP